MQKSARTPVETVGDDPKGKSRRTGPDQGMVVDFGELKDKVKEIADEFDHALIMEKTH